MAGKLIATGLIVLGIVWLVSCLGGPPCPDCDGWWRLDEKPEITSICSGRVVSQGHTDGKTSVTIETDCP
ncbi:MAG: hypothetical protein RLZZ416_582 [Candidatus Parcubacteria bacterium]